MDVRNIHVGDKVQIVDGGMDVISGIRAKSGSMYGEGGPLWATVDLIDPDWHTSGLFGLPRVITKVRCTDENLVVWQVQPKDIASNIIYVSDPNLIQTASTPREKQLSPTDQGLEDLSMPDSYNEWGNKVTSLPNNTPYALVGDTIGWYHGMLTAVLISGILPKAEPIRTKIVTGSSIDSNNYFMYPYTNGIWRSLTAKEKRIMGGSNSNIKVDPAALLGAKFRTSWQIPNRRREMLNEDKENKQNYYGYPAYAEKSKGLNAAKYDYQIIPSDIRFPVTIKLETKLQEVRASLGIPVHGSNSIARAMKYYMYNRFKSPDTNMLHNKSVTYVFFSRPDLNILTGCGTAFSARANKQTLNHTESSMIWRRYPEIFKLLTDARRTGDDNNFNLLLSNQVTSFDIIDEELSTVDAGRSWRDYTISYGDAYTGRTAGTFSCNFTETNDYSIINMIKLWINYIDNVSSGAWSPSYNLPSGGEYPSWSSPSSSHVFTKTLDYAASAYVFKCGPDGEDVLYWSKYYGIFPINTGASALSWDNDSPIGNGVKLNIRFKYAFKRDLSPISLMEFNRLSGLSTLTGNRPISESSFNPNYNHSSRPFVGAPFIEMTMPAGTNLAQNGVLRSTPRTSIRLKFRHTGDSSLTDDIVYRYNLSNRSVI